MEKELLLPVGEFEEVFRGDLQVITQDDLNRWHEYQLCNLFEEGHSLDPGEIALSKKQEIPILAAVQTVYEAHRLQLSRAFQDSQWKKWVRKLGEQVEIIDRVQGFLATKQRNPYSDTNIPHDYARFEVGDLQQRKGLRWVLEVRALVTACLECEEEQNIQRQLIKRIRKACNNTRKEFSYICAAVPMEDESLQEIYEQFGFEQVMDSFPDSGDTRWLVYPRNWRERWHESPVPS